VRLADFEDLVRRLQAEIPSEFLAGVHGIEVSRKTLPHPTRAEVYTLGECVPIGTEAEGGVEGLQSRVVLYYGSFVALARLAEDFDWRTETWETLTHELRHHLEWRARVPDLEAFDWAAEQNFARAEGGLFDAEFHLSAEPVAEAVYRIDDDYFLDREVRELPEDLQLEWHGASYLIAPPEGTTLPAFLEITGVTDPPPGDLILVLRCRQGFWQLFRRRPPAFQATVEARPARTWSPLSSRRRDAPRRNEES
jgi:hypothetical protein